MEGMGMVGYDGVSGHEWPHRLEDDDTAERESQWRVLRALWTAVPEPEWTAERAERIFARVSESIARRERQRAWTFRASALVLPAIAGLALGRFMR